MQLNLMDILLNYYIVYILFSAVNVGEHLSRQEVLDLSRDTTLYEWTTQNTMKPLVIDHVRLFLHFRIFDGMTMIFRSYCHV